LREATEHFAREAGTPFLSFFAPEDLQNMARQAGFVTAEHISAAQLAERYFSQRTDGLRPIKFRRDHGRQNVSGTGLEARALAAGN
jgi:O-methyltransferase involved in polyketide biosynthesis